MLPFFIFPNPRKGILKQLKAKKNETYSQYIERVGKLNLRISESFYVLSEWQNNELKIAEGVRFLNRIL